MGGELKDSEAKKGFTIIELVLVLAIGGLIFLMVFIALPALQRSQRNTQRRNDIDRVMSALAEYQSNNSGQLPFNKLYSTQVAEKFLKRYVDTEAPNLRVDEIGGVTGCSDGFRDPDGECYRFRFWGYIGRSYSGWTPIEEGELMSQVLGKAGTAEGFDHTINIVSYAECDSIHEGYVKKASGVNQAALVFVLEGGSVYCVDNS